MSDQGGFPYGGAEAKYWYLDLSVYEQEDNCIRDDGQIQAFNFSLEPDELELGPANYTRDSAFPKRHTMPDFGISPTSSNSLYACPAHPVSTSPKRAETLPTTIEGLNIARNKKLLDGLLSKINPEATPPSSERGSEPSSDTSEVAQSLQVNPITDLGCEWPVPRFFLDQISPPPEPDGRLKPFGNIQSKDIEDNEINDYCSIAEDVDSVPVLGFPFNPTPGPYFKVTHSDSGIGSSTESYKPGPNSVAESYKHTPSNKGGISSRDPQAKGASASASMSAVRYQQAAAKFGPLTSAASSTAGSVETARTLSETALKTMKTIILEPILKDSRFQAFWDICRMAGEHMESGQIGSLRDIEKFVCHKASNINNQAHINFCKEFLNNVQESLKYMPQNELLRPNDRPYDRGYFLDTLAPFAKGTMQSSTVFEFSHEEEDLYPITDRWLPQLSQQSQPSQPSQPEKRVAEADTAHGSLAKRPRSNRFGLVVDTQNYSAFPDSSTQETTPMSGPMGLPFVPPRLKSASPTQYQSNKTKHRGRAQQVKEQQIFPCTWKDCIYPAFTRACDLTKHEKTHTRPHKCRVVNCKYAIEGFPTEKERDRHWTDKHSSDTPAFRCIYFPCTYKSKRESNCKQHMEKAHGYTYVRMKQNYKANGAKRQSNSPTSPGDQESPMGASPPSQQHFVSQPSTTTSQYQATAFQPSMGNEFPQTRHQNQYSGRDLATLEEIIRSMGVGDNGSQSQGTLMFPGTQEHTNTPGSFGQSTPYPPDVMDLSNWDYTPMPVPPIPDDDDENIDPNLEMGGSMEGYSSLRT